METNKAKEYAEGKAVDALTAMIEQAYNDGYKAGYEDGLANQKSEDAEPQSTLENIEFVDLGLPSGTKWSSSYLKDKDGNIHYMPYNEASELEIPTEEQYRELVKCCETKAYPNIGYYKGEYFIGLNGNTIDLPYDGYKKAMYYNSIDSYLFWLKMDSIPESGMISCASGNLQERTKFVGYQLPVMLVKK